MIKKIILAAISIIFFLTGCCIFEPNELFDSSITITYGDGTIETFGIDSILDQELTPSDYRKIKLDFKEDNDLSIYQFEFLEFCLLSDNHETVNVEVSYIHNSSKKNLGSKEIIFEENESQILSLEFEETFEQNNSSILIEISPVDGNDSVMISIRDFTLLGSEIEQ